MMNARAVVFVVGFVLAFATAARGDDDVPWARGVSEQNKAAAQRVLDQGNELLLQNSYREALEKYQEAVALWDHPAIRFNMVRALIALGRPVEASENLERALAYGVAPLNDDVYREALNYQRLLVGQIATLEVTCGQPGARITLDGAALVTCPGKKTVRTTPGAHALVGKKPDYLARTFELILLPGKSRTVDVSLVALSAAAVTHRWTVWKPWAVAGGGVALLGIGALLENAARSNYASYDDHVRLDCPPSGCPVDDPYLVSHQRRARLEEGFGWGSIIVGGSALATGVVLLVMNRARAYVPEQTPVVTPTITSGGAGVAVSGAF